MAVLLILSALLIGIGRELVKEVDYFHPMIQQWLSEKTALSVQFSRMDGEWKGTSPELRFYDVSVQNPSAPLEQPLKMARMAVRISLGRSLLTLSPSLRLQVQGAEARIRKEADGFTLLGKTLGHSPDSTSKNPATWLLSQPKISVIDSRLVLDGVYERRTDVRIPQLRLFWQGDRAFAEGDLVVSGPDEIRVSMKSDLTLVKRQGGEVQGVTYLNVSEGQLSRWIPPSLAEKMPVQIEGLRGKTETWMRWYANSLLSATARFDWRDARFKVRDGSDVALKRLSGLARWQGKIDEFWQLALRDITLESTDATWRPAALTLNALHDGATETWRYQAALADASFVGGFQPLLSLLPPDSRLREALTVLQPTGRVQDLRVNVHRNSRGWGVDQAQGVLREYAQKPWEKIPGLTNAGAAFWFEEDALWVDFNERNVVLDYPAMFRAPLSIDTLTGSLVARWDAEKIVVRSSPIALATAHGKAATLLRLEFPRNAVDIPANIALHMTLQDVAAENAPTYLPVGVIPEKLLAWLDNAFKAGRLVQGDILIHGPLRKPDIDGERSVLLGFKVEDASLQFLPAWKEPIRHLSGDAIVENGYLHAQTRGGDYYGLSLGPATVWTAREGKDNLPHLHVETQGHGDAAAGMRLLRESPLGKTLRTPLSDMAFDGALNIDFAVNAPLVKGQKLAGKTTVTLDQGRLDWPAQRLTVDKLGLVLSYDMQKGLATQKLNGNVFDSAVSGKLYNAQEKGRRILRLDLQGHANLVAVKDWLNMPQLGLAEGVIPYGLQFYFRPVESALPSSLLLASSLQGVAIDLPPPFGKAAETSRPVTLQYSLAGDTRTHTLNYDDQLDLIWQQQTGHETRAGIRLGEGRAQLAETHRWRLSGSLERFRWSDWSPTVDKLKTMSKNTGLPGTSVLAEVGASTLSVGHLHIGDEDLQRVSLSLNADPHYVTVAAQGERLQGRLTLPRTYLDSPADRSQETPVALYLQRLLLTETHPDADPPPDPALDALPPPPSLDPRLLPAAHVRIDQLRRGENDLGRYSMTLIPQADGVRTEDLRFSLKSADFSGAAQWIRRGDSAHTSLKGIAHAANIASVLTGWQYTPSLDSETASVDMDIHWLGAPYQFKLARTEGTVQAQLKNGHFLKVSNSAAGRVWGLLNFDTWMSRLQLRFSDLSDSEMPYKDINGSFQLHNNQIEVNRLRIDSPALKMKMKGQVNMNQRQLNMQWYVTLPVTRNLMLPAAVVGGFPGAATAYVIDKMLSRQIDKLTTLTYDVTGAFDEPNAKLRIPL